MVPLGPAGSVLGDAVVAVAAAGAAAAGRWPALAVSGWELAAAVTAGSLVPVRRLPRLSRLSRGPATDALATVQRELPSALAR